MEDFPCTSCGKCCEKVGEVLKNQHLADPLTSFLLSKFPYKTKEDGSCEMLVDGLCSVYLNRPIICNIKAMARLKGIPLDDYYRESAEYCNILINASDLPDKYLVKF